MQEPSMRSLGVLLAVALMLLAPPIELAARQKITPGTPRDQVREMDPADVDASDLPLDPISSLHVTGAPQDRGPGEMASGAHGHRASPPRRRSPTRTSSGMPTVTRRAILICPGVFADYAEWQGVPLDAVLARAGLSASWSKVSFVSLDGYREEFTQDEVAVPPPLSGSEGERAGPASGSWVPDPARRCGPLRRPLGEVDQRDPGGVRRGPSAVDGRLQRGRGALGFPGRRPVRIFSSGHVSNLLRTALHDLSPLDPGSGGRLGGHRNRLRRSPVRRR